MNVSSQMLTLPLSQSDCQWAESQAIALCDLSDFEHGDPSEPVIAHHIQCSTLASLAARYYLKLLGINSELTFVSSADSPASKHPSDYFRYLTGELTLDSNQRLHCLPVFAGHPLIDKAFALEPDHPIDSDNLGTIAIQLDLSQRTAQVVGFLPQFAPTAAAIGAAHKLPPFQSIAMLINRLSASPITHLQQWLVGQAVTGWQQLCQPKPAPAACFRTTPVSKSAHSSNFTPAIEAALLSAICNSADDEQRWQAAEQLWNLNPSHPKSPILRTKDMGLYLLGHNVTLLVGILAKPDQQRLILVRLLPSGDQPYLPQNLTLTGQDEVGDTVFSIRSRQQDDYIQFKFTAAVGDQFQLHIGWNTASITEQFIV